MELKTFLVKAKIATYASNGEGNEKKLEDGSRELVFNEANFFYRDRYFGTNPFIGEEVVWENNVPVWCMNYAGKTLSGDPKEVYSFLKKVLRLVEEETPYRGPAIYEEGNWRYVNSVDGDISCFKGSETIFFGKEKAYELHYHGGFVS